MITSAVVGEPQIFDWIREEIKNIGNSAIKLTKFFGMLSSEGVKRAKIEFRMSLSGAIIDRLVAAGKIGYPEHMVLKAGIDVGTWRLLEPEAKQLAMNKSATVYLKVHGRADPVIKTVESMTVPELKQAFRPKYKGQVPVGEQIEIPPVMDKKKVSLPKGDLDDFEEVSTIVASGTEFVIIKGSRGGVMKCHMKVLKNIIK